MTNLSKTETKWIPMLFSTDMVLALLNDTKTETRRLVKDQNKRPYKVGDKIWVKETFRPDIKVIGSANPNEILDTQRLIRYKAGVESVILNTEDNEWFDNITKDGKFNYISSMFMPRRFSRISLEITGVDIERLQDITPEAAIAEGIECVNIESKSKTLYKDYISEKNSCSAITSYKSLWEKINGAGSWDLNPLVWRVQFKKIKKI